MKTLVKINNSELSYRLKLNYNTVFSRLKMLLGRKASLFADISTKSTVTTWYSDDDSDYLRLNEAPKGEVNAISVALNQVVTDVRKELSSSPELSKYVDDILEVPDNSFVFYRKTSDGYKFVLAGWGCKFAHQSSTDSNSGYIKRISKELEMPNSPEKENVAKNGDITGLLSGIYQNKSVQSEGFPQKYVEKELEKEPRKDPVNTHVKEDKTKDKENPDGLIDEEPTDNVTPNENKTQNVILRVFDQNNHPVVGEVVTVSTKQGEDTKVTSDDGTANIGRFSYGESFSVSFPNVKGNQERAYEVEPNVECYDAYIKKLVKYSPVLFVEDQNGNSVQDYNVKIVINGQDSIYNTGIDGVIQLPSMLEGQKFIAIDTLNYANTEEFNITQKEAKVPYHFYVKRAEKTKVGVTILDKSGNPIPKANVELSLGDTPCQQLTAEDGRAEFPQDVFVKGEIPVICKIKGKGQIKAKLNYMPDITEYTIQLQDKNPLALKGFDWKWLAMLPLLLLMSLGGYKLYDWWQSKQVPPFSEMEKGICLIFEAGYYSVDLGLPDVTINGNPAIYYFTYNENTQKFSEPKNDPSEIPNLINQSSATGTGFLISDDGMIATNRHVAYPMVPKEAVTKYFKEYFQKEKNGITTLFNNVVDSIGKYGPRPILTNHRKKLEEVLGILDRILNTGQFDAKYNQEILSVAFSGTRVEKLEDFIGCSRLGHGDPCGVKEKDVAIIKIKKAQDIPQVKYVFKIPDKDLLENDVPDNYEITVIGYNAGFRLQDMEVQEGIKPQAQHGKITNTSEKYRVGYDAPILGGSSGSPVLNQNHQLVAINNSGIGSTQGFNYGIRIKYLRELLAKVKDNTAKE